MECEPAASALVLQVAVRVFPEPLRATLEQPEMELPPSVKLTVPVGPKPVTEAVNMTFAPNAAGLDELASVVLLAALLTTCERVPLVELALFASPE